MKTVEAFATGSSPVRILIATDVASEGINLHHQCHHIIHYDLPWSVITLIQRNGRIDRLGQKESPVLRYLRVNTRQGLLQGDQAIFDRLIAKVEEINRLRKAGESVLQLYDPKAEEEYLANRGVLAGDPDVLEKPASLEDGPRFPGSRFHGFAAYGRRARGKRGLCPARGRGNRERGKRQSGTGRIACGKRPRPFRTVPSLFRPGIFDDRIPFSAGKKRGLPSLGRKEELRRPDRARRTSKGGWENPAERPTPCSAPPPSLRSPGRKTTSSG